MSNFNYCPLTWHFCSQASTNKMEIIQERVLRFICNDFTSNVETLLLLNNAVPLHIGRMKLMASFFFKYYIICHNPSYRIWLKKRFHIMISETRNLQAYIQSLAENGPMVTEKSKFNFHM